MNKTDRMGGEANIRGIRYQLYFAIYRFLCSDSNEILLEWLDEDVVIVNEDKSDPSLEFIQCKYIGAGGLSFSTFYNEIFRNFIQIFEKLKKDNPNTKYAFTIACNKGLESNMDRFSRIPRLLREGVPVENIERLYFRTLLSKINNKDYIKNTTIDLYYFLQFLYFHNNYTQEYLIEEIHKCLISFGCSNPIADTDRILSYFMNRGYGKITKNQLKKELGLDYPLFEIQTRTSTHFKTELTINNINKISDEAGETSTTIHNMFTSIYGLDKFVNLAELTTDQLTYKKNLYPIGKSERREIERSSDDTIEIAGDVSKSIKSIKETMGTISIKMDEIKFLRRKYELDKNEGT